MAVLIWLFLVIKIQILVIYWYIAPPLQNVGKDIDSFTKTVTLINIGSFVDELKEFHWLCWKCRRTMVPGFPVIDYDKCTNCMQCLSFCLFGVWLR
jgi:hypothetical protein